MNAQNIIGYIVVFGTMFGTAVLLFNGKSVVYQPPEREQQIYKLSNETGVSAYGVRQVFHRVDGQ